MIKRKYFIAGVVCLTLFCAVNICISNYYNKTIKELEDAKNYMTTVQNELENELYTTKSSLQIEIEKNSALFDRVENIESKLNAANSTLDDLKSEEYEFVYLGNFKLTAYCAEKTPHICGEGRGITASGTMATPGRTIGVDPSVIPYGTQVYIEGVGYRVAEDTGGGVGSQHIDVLVDTHENALSLGVSSGDVWVLVKKS